MKEYKKEKKGTFKLLLRVILHPCERKYIINWLLLSITWRLPCISIKWTKLQCLSLTVVQHDKGMTNHGLQVNQHNRPAYPVSSAQEAMLRREIK